MPSHNDVHDSEFVSSRLRLGIRVEGKAAEKLTDLTVRLKKGALFSGVKLQWVETNSWFITIHTLPGGDPEQLAHLENGMHAEGCGEGRRFLCALGSLAIRPSLQTPKILSLSVLEGVEALHGIYAAISNILQRPSEPLKYFSASLSIARFESPRGTAAFNSVVRAHRTNSYAQFHAEAVELVQDSVSDSGELHRQRLAHWPLRDADELPDKTRTTGPS